jgi:hypothetical protein
MDFGRILIDLINIWGKGMLLGHTTLFIFNDDEHIRRWATSNDKCAANVEPQVLRMSSHDMETPLCTCGHDYDRCALAVIAFIEDEDRFNVLYHRAFIQ